MRVRRVHRCPRSAEDVTDTADRVADRLGGLGHEVFGGVERRKRRSSGRLDHGFSAVHALEPCRRRDLAQPDA